jgi:hypothetical protein
MSQTRYEGFLPGSHVIEGYGAGGFRFADMAQQSRAVAGRVADEQGWRRALAVEHRPVERHGTRRAGDRVCPARPEALLEAQ